jgi:hypothetical protein
LFDISDEDEDCGSESWSDAVTIQKKVSVKLLTPFFFACPFLNGLLRDGGGKPIPHKVVEEHHTAPVASEPVPAQEESVSARTARRRRPARNPIVKMRLTRLPILDRRCSLINYVIWGKPASTPCRKNGWQTVD